MLAVHACGQGFIRIMSIVDGKELQRMAIKHNDFRSIICWSGDNRWLATFNNTEILILDVCTGRQVFELTGHSEHLKSVSFSHDCTRLVSSSFDFTVCLFALFD